MKNKTLLERIELLLNEEDDDTMVHGEEEPKTTDIARAKSNDKEYKAFFMKKMKEWNIKSIEDLSDEDKKKFFDEIDREWTKEDDED